LTSLSFFPSLSAVKRFALFIPALLLGGLAQAQTIDSLAWVEGAPHPTARVTFNANVRFVGVAPTEAADLYQVTFQIVAADDAVLAQTAQESKRLAEDGQRPGLALTYEPVAAARSRMMTLRLSRRALVAVRQGPGARAIDIDFGAPAQPQPGAAHAGSMPAMAETASERRFAVVLQTYPAGARLDAPRIPVTLQDYVVYTVPIEQDGVRKIALAVGYFRTQQDAQAVRQAAAAQYPGASVLPLGRDAQPAGAAVTAAPIAAPPAAGDVATRQDEAALLAPNPQAAEMLAAAEAALGQKQFRQAETLLDKALLLPPNASSQRAQELIGQAWEGLGEPAKARAEYQLYLKLYPQGEGARRVAQSLAALGAPGSGATPSTAASPAQTAAAGTGLKYTGSLSQFYYGGKSKSQSLVNISAAIDQNTLTRTNQSALVTSVDLSGSYRTEGSETRLVLRDTASKNFMASSTAHSVLSAAYVDWRDTQSRIGIRVGRQSAIAGSLFGLFDGASISVPLGSTLKLNAMAGAPANTLVNAPSQRLLGVMLETETILDHWGGELSYTEQKSQGISDRRSVGLQVRYFADRISAFGQLDYNPTFRTLNAATLQGSLQGPMDTMVTVLLDDRKAPSLQLSDALISSGAVSLKTLLQLKTLAEVQDMARGTVAQARQAVLSVSRPIAPKWQASLDLRYGNVGPLPAVGDFLATPGTGPEYTLAMQLTGSNLYSRRDINNFNVSAIRGSSMHGVQLAYNNLTGMAGDRATLEPSLRVYYQRDTSAIRVLRIAPALRVSYKLSERGSLLGETMVERSNTDGPASHDRTTSVFFYIGYRYELF